MSICRLLFSLLVCCIAGGASSQELPPGVPNPIGPDGKYAHDGMMFTTRAYEREAFDLMLQEANEVAREMSLPEYLPIAKTNIIQAFIPPFGYAFAKKTIGFVATTNFAYYVSRGNKFSYLEGVHQDADCRRYQALYTWPVSRIDTNQAFQQATQWLTAASMDVKGLNRDFQVFIQVDDSYVQSAAGKFVPIYYIYWAKAKTGVGSAASVRVFTPTRTLLHLHVEDPKYILRKPLVFQNLAALLSQTNTPAKTNALRFREHKTVN